MGGRDGAFKPWRRKGPRGVVHSCSHLLLSILSASREEGYDSLEAVYSLQGVASDSLHLEVGGWGWRDTTVGKMNSFWSKQQRCTRRSLMQNIKLNTNRERKL